MLATPTQRNLPDAYSAQPLQALFFLRTGLHAPLDYGPPLYPGEDHVEGDSDERYSHQAREHVWYPQEVAGVVYEVAQTPASSGDAEDQLGRDDRAPPEGPAGFEPANRVRQRRRHQHVLDQLETSQPQIASYHEDGGINGAEACAHVDRYGPRYRVGNDEDERRRAQAEPEYGERQDRDRRQRVEHRSQQHEHVLANAGPCCEGGQHGREAHPDEHPQAQYLQGHQRRGGQFSAYPALPERLGNLRGTGDKQRAHARDRYVQLPEQDHRYKQYRASGHRRQRRPP